MRVKAVSVTKPIIEGIDTAEDLISYCARVSNPSNQLNLDTGSKLLKYCMEHKHWSIFEHADLAVEIETSRAIAAQILRHRSFVFQEFSQRYAEVTWTEYELYDARRQDTKNRQNSIDDMSEEDTEWFYKAQDEVWDKSFLNYKQALSRGIAKEQARFLLPLNTSTRMYMKGNIRNWIHYLEVRTDPSTQKEHRDVALKIKELFVEQFPVIAEVKGWK